MYFLWRFGDNVEESLGRLRFLFFYLACGIVADAAHVLVNPTSALPAVGASGAVSGVLGAYLVLYPIARLRAVFSRYFLFELPAISYLGGWFFYQFLMGILLRATGGATGVAWFAHLGGFLTGVLLTHTLMAPQQTGLVMSEAQERSTWPSPPDDQRTNGRVLGP